MPSGLIHSRATLLCSVAAGALVYFHQDLAPAILLLPVGCLAGLLITPDLDVRTSPTAAHYNMNRFSRAVSRGQGPRGCLFKPWYLLWWPYSHLVPHHRHWLSHGFIIGTAVRLLYLSVFTGLILLVKYWIVSPFFWWFAAGLLMSDTLHELMDFTWPPRRLAYSLRHAWRQLRHNN